MALHFIAALSLRHGTCFLTGTDGKPELPPGPSTVRHRKPAHLPAGGTDWFGCWCVLCGTDCSGHRLHIQVRNSGIVSSCTTLFSGCGQAYTSWA